MTTQFEDAHPTPEPGGRMLTAHAEVITHDPARYARQLVSHLGRRVTFTTTGTVSTARFGAGSGRVMRAGVQKVWGPGRHVAGDNTFTYFLDPHGNTVEYTTELEQLDEDTWHPHIYDLTKPENADQWGTSNPMNEMVAKEMLNDVDRGVFVAPPV